MNSTIRNRRLRCSRWRGDARHRQQQSPNARSFNSGTTMLAKNTNNAMGQDPECSNASTPLMMVSFSSSNKGVRIHHRQHVGRDVEQRRRSTPRPRWRRGCGACARCKARMAARDSATVGASRRAPSRGNRGRRETEAAAGERCSRPTPFDPSPELLGWGDAGQRGQSEHQQPAGPNETPGITSANSESLTRATSAPT